MSRCVRRRRARAAAGRGRSSAAHPGRGPQTAVGGRYDQRGRQAQSAAAYNPARDDEYEEIVDKCRDFLAESRRRPPAEHSSYAELEENEDDLTKLRHWHDKVAAPRQPARVRRRTRQPVEQCSQALDGFAHHVYAANSDGS